MNPQISGQSGPARPVALVLAAGASRRLGSPKQLVRLGGETLLQRAVRVAGEAGCRVLAVLGCDAERILKESGLIEIPLQGAEVVFNPQWAGGMATSIHAGLAAAGEARDGLLVLTCDQPAVTAAHLRRLIAGGAGGVVASAYAGRRGVPAFFPYASLGLLRGLQGDAGARELLAECRVVDLPLGELDVDTPAALEAARLIWDTQG